MWFVQTALLRAAGTPVRWRIDSREAPPSVRIAGRITTQVCLIAVIAAYPLIRGRPVFSYYEALLPRGPSTRHFIQGAAAAILCLALLYLVWIETQRVQVKSRLSRKKCLKRLTLLIPTAIFGAAVEEVLFRGVVMADLMRTTLPDWLIVAASALVFAVAHYVRAVKRKWTFPGHLALGIVLSLAFLRTGTLWLSTGLHAGGIFMIMGTRPFFWYKGPRWITGESIFPFAGAIGMLGLLVLCGFVAQHYPR
jgi:membrane protease YdiL (CAAX protease family)